VSRSSIAEELLAEEVVDLCHPELVRSIRRRTAFGPQWHLKKTIVNGQSVDAAWPQTFPVPLSGLMFKAKVKV